MKSGRVLLRYNGRENLKATTVQSLKQFLHTVNTMGKKGEIFPQPAWLPAFLAI
jgi:hypothetical protein